MSITTGYTIGGVLTSCMGCLICIEAVIKEEPGSGVLLSFGSFVFVCIEGLINTTRLFTCKNQIPLKAYIPTMLTFFSVHTANNLALNYRIPVPLQIVFNSGSLLATMLLTKFLNGAKHSVQKYVSVITITIGITMCTMATANAQSNSHAGISDLVLGVTLMCLSVFGTAYLSICQKQMFVKYGNHHREAMFYVHFLSLPIFSLMLPSIAKYLAIFSNSRPAIVFGISTNIPEMWLFLFGYSLLQWCCIRFVYRLNTQVHLLTVMLVVTLRKFLSLIFSIWWFENAFAFWHWIGAVFVFGGTLLFVWEPNGDQAGLNEKKTE